MGELDYLLLDLPPGTGDVALDVHSMLPSSKEIIVTTPHPTAAFVAARAGQWQTYRALYSRCYRKYELF